MWGVLWVVVVRQTHFGGSLQLPSIDEQRNELLLLRRLDGEDVMRVRSLLSFEIVGHGSFLSVTVGGKWTTVRAR